MSKVWLMTGASKGLGRSILEAALAEGGKAVATASDIAPLADLKKRHGDRLLLCRLDVTDDFGAMRAVKVALAAYGRLDVLVNHAGYGHPAPFQMMGHVNLRAQIDINMTGVANMVRAVLPAMRERGSGTVINLSSIEGCLPASDFGTYEAAKGAVRGFTEVLAHHAETIGVRAIALEQAGNRSGAVTARDSAKVARLVSCLPDEKDLPGYLVFGADTRPVYKRPEGSAAAPSMAWLKTTTSGGSQAYHP